MKRFASWLLVFLVGAGGAGADQLAYQAKAVGRDVRFDYRWLDAQSREQHVSFALPQDDLLRGRDEFQPFDNAAANQYAYGVVKAFADSRSAGGMVYKVAQTFGGFSVEAQGNNSASAQAKSTMSEIEALRDKAIDQYLTLQFYTKVDETHVMPDHKRIAKRYAGALAPVEQAMLVATHGQDVRQVINYLLGFLQSIPYDQLMSRYTSNGAGFVTPYGLIWGNKGDCDTKSVALMAMLRGLYPTLRLTMVYVPDHAFVGIALPRGDKDYALQMGGAVFVLADPTGPRLMEVGEVDPTALADLEAGKYSYQEVPF